MAGKTYEELISRLTHSNPGVRKEAVKGLGDLNNPAALPQLQGLLNDPEPAVRLLVKRVIKKLETAPPVPESKPEPAQPPQPAQPPPPPRPARKPKALIAQRPTPPPVPAPDVQQPPPDAAGAPPDGAPAGEAPHQDESPSSKFQVPESAQITMPGAAGTAPKAAGPAGDSSFGAVLGVSMNAFKANLTTFLTIMAFPAFVGLVPHIEPLARLAAVFAGCLLTHVTWRYVSKNERPTFSEALESGKSLMMPMVAVALSYGLVVIPGPVLLSSSGFVFALGLLLCVPGVYVAIVYGFCVKICVIRALPPVASFQASKAFFDSDRKAIGTFVTGLGCVAMIVLYLAGFVATTVLAITGMTTEDSFGAFMRNLVFQVFFVPCWILWDVAMVAFFHARTQSR